MHSGNQSWRATGWHYCHFTVPHLACGLCRHSQRPIHFCGAKAVCPRSALTWSGHLPLDVHCPRSGLCQDPMSATSFTVHVPSLGGSKPSVVWCCKRLCVERRPRLHRVGFDAGTAIAACLLHLRLGRQCSIDLVYVPQLSNV